MGQNSNDEYTHRIKCEISGRILRWTFICDIGNWASESRSISERSNLYNSFPIALSTDKAGNISEFHFSLINANVFNALYVANEGRSWRGSPIQMSWWTASWNHLGQWNQNKRQVLDTPDGTSDARIWASRTCPASSTIRTLGPILCIAIWARHA